MCSPIFCLPLISRSRQNYMLQALSAIVIFCIKSISVFRVLSVHDFISLNNKSLHCSPAQAAKNFKTNNYNSFISRPPTETVKTVLSKIQSTAAFQVQKYILPSITGIFVPTKFKT